MNYKKKLLYLVLSVSLIRCTPANSDANSMDKLIRKVNQKCPVMVDSETQLDGIELKNAHTILYNYTLIHTTVAAIDTHQFYLSMWPGILSTIRVSPEMQELRDNKMSVWYHYRDGYQKDIYTFKISPSDYQKQNHL